MGSSFATAALLAGCGASQPPIAAPGAMSQSSAIATHADRSALASSHEKTFSYIGRSQTFTVPSGITQIEVDARGAQGGGSDGGLGGRVVAIIAVTPAQKLRVLVGGQPSATSGGFNGGGNGGTTSCADYCGYGGGGASDVREGATGVGNPGGAGTLGVGGAGGQGCTVKSCIPGANGGGAAGGYYGGGGGGAGGSVESLFGAGGGGGGGSSYAEPTAKIVSDLRGAKDATGNGLVVIRW